MKYIVLSLLLIGCSQSENNSITETNKLNEKIDSLLIKSQRNIDSASVQLTKIDSAVVEKVEKTVQKIGNLETENKQLKEENNELKTELNNTKSSGRPYKLLPTVSGN
jgi:vacuolar-type H+-ATPase subunit I/STV1